MRKISHIVLATCFLALVQPNVYAQSVGGGIKIGANIAKVTNEDLKIMPGGHFGFFMRAGAGNYRFQGEVLLTTGGSNYKEGDDVRISNITFNLDVPLMFNYKFVKVLFAEAGMQPSYLITNYEFGTVGNRMIDEFTVEGLRRVNFAPVLGFGVDLQKVTIGLRFVYPVTSMYDKETLDDIRRFSEELYKEYKKEKQTQTMLTFGFKF